MRPVAAAEDDDMVVTISDCAFRGVVVVAVGVVRLAAASALAVRLRGAGCCSIAVVVVEGAKAEASCCFRRSEFTLLPEEFPISLANRLRYAANRSAGNTTPGSDCVTPMKPFSSSTLFLSLLNAAVVVASAAAMPVGVSTSSAVTTAAAVTVIDTLVVVGVDVGSSCCCCGGATMLQRTMTGATPFRSRTDARIVQGGRRLDGGTSGSRCCTSPSTVLPVVVVVVVVVGGRVGQSRRRMRRIRTRMAVVARPRHPCSRHAGCRHGVGHDAGV